MAQVQVLCLPATPYIFHEATGNGIVDGPMESLPTFRLSTRRWSLDDLSSELLALIFEQVRDIDRFSLDTIRRVSKRFNDIVTPIRYSSLRLTERIVDPQAEIHFPDALERIYAYTRHVEARSNLSVHHVKCLLDRVARLSSFKWSYAGYDAYTGGGGRGGTPPCWTPSDVLSRRHLEVDKTQLHVEDLPLPSYSDLLEHVYVRGIPAGNLASLRLAAPNPPLTTRLEPLQRLLLRARHLRTLDYRDSGQGTHFSFLPNNFTTLTTKNGSADDDNDDCDGGDDDDVDGERGRGRLPALEELTLQSYDWDHDAADAAAHWDFSRLRALALIDVPALPFLTAVPPRALRGLRALRCDDRSPSSYYYASDAGGGGTPGRGRSQDAVVVTTTQLLADLIREIRALRSLELTCHARLLFPQPQPPPAAGDDDGGGGGGGMDDDNNDVDDDNDNDNDYDHDYDYDDYEDEYDEGEDEDKNRDEGKSASSSSSRRRRRRRGRRREGDYDDGAGDHVLFRHAPTLGVLRLRDPAGFVDEDRPCPTLRAADVAGLARRLARLRELELDLDAADCDDAARFLRALCAFPRLEVLTLHVQTVVKPWEALARLSASPSASAEGGGQGALGEGWGERSRMRMSDPGAGVIGEDEEEDDDGGQRSRHHNHFDDADYAAAIRVFEALVRGKRERRRQQQQRGGGENTVVVPWRRITLVVGGWRPFMVRRTSAVWRALNARGVFAERCFVLEGEGEGAGAGGESGDAAVGAHVALMVREEMTRTVEG